MNKIKSQIKFFTRYARPKNINKLEQCDDTIENFSFKNKIFLAKVVRVYDGDTLWCVFKFAGKYAKFKIRMLGYNSPELKPNKNNSETENIEMINNAKVARDRLSELVLNKIVYLYCYDFDSFGRILAEIKINKKDKLTVNQIMLQENLAVVF